MIESTNPIQEDSPHPETGKKQEGLKKTKMKTQPEFLSREAFMRTYA